MQTPTTTAFDGSFFTTHSFWNEVPTVHVWRWAFSDLPDDGLKTEVADLIAKVLLGADPGAMSPEELLVLSMCSLFIPEAHVLESACEPDTGIEFDA